MPSRSPKFGFGLWDHKWETFALEVFLFTASLVAYTRACRPSFINRDNFWARRGVLLLFGLGLFAQSLSLFPHTLTHKWQMVPNLLFATAAFTYVGAKVDGVRVPMKSKH